MPIKFCIPWGSKGHSRRLKRFKKRFKKKIIKEGDKISHLKKQLFFL